MIYKTHGNVCQECYSSIARQEGENQNLLCSPHGEPTIEQMICVSLVKEPAQHCNPSRPGRAGVGSLKSCADHVFATTPSSSERGTDGLQLVLSGPSMRAIPAAANSFLISSDFSYCFAFLAAVLSSIFCRTCSSVMDALLSAFSRSCCRA